MFSYISISQMIGREGRCFAPVKRLSGKIVSKMTCKVLSIR